MKLKAIKYALITASLSIASATAFSATGVYSQLTADTTLKSNLTAQEAAIISKVQQQQNLYVKNLMTNTDRIVEAIRVATAQEAISATQIGRADRDTKQLMVGAIQADAAAGQMQKAVLDFGPATGQGYAACVVLAENTRMGQVMSTVDSQAAVKVLESDNSPSSAMPDAGAAFKDRLSVHNKTFCTDAEGERDVCDPVSPEMQGADSNAATLFVSAPMGSDMSVAKQAVRQNILGAPSLGIPSRSASTASGQAYLYAVNHKTALSAFPAYSLAYLESMSEIREDIKDADGNPMSPNDMLFNTVARYYGGKDSEAWAASMISQQPRGLLVELAKMEGLGSWMDYQEYLSLQRMEGNLAAMTLTSALPMEARLKKQYDRANNQAISKNLVK